MNKKRMILRDVHAPDDHRLDFSNIENNTVAQQYLLRRWDEVSSDMLFEEIYQSQMEQGEEMIRRRAMRRAYDEKHDLQEETSFLHSPKKEREVYDRLAADQTAKVMRWLKKVKKV